MFKVMSSNVQHNVFQWRQYPPRETPTEQSTPWIQTIYNILVCGMSQVANIHFRAMLNATYGNYTCNKSCQRLGMHMYLFSITPVSHVYVFFALHFVHTYRTTFGGTGFSPLCLVPQTSHKGCWHSLQRSARFPEELRWLNAVPCFHCLHFKHCLQFSQCQGSDNGSRV